VTGARARAGSGSTAKEAPAKAGYFFCATARTLGDDLRPPVKDKWTGASGWVCRNPFVPVSMGPLMKDGPDAARANDDAQPPKRCESESK